MKKLIIAVVGQSGAGKDTLTNRYAKENGIPIVCSYTDRPMRPTEKQNREHIFVSKEEMDKITKDIDSLLAYTQIGETGYRYCVPSDYLDRLEGKAAFYIIDPDGIAYLKEHCPQYPLLIVSVQSDIEIRRARAEKRNGEKTTFEKRYQNEHKQFDAFEENRGNYDILIWNNTTVEEAYQDFERELSNRIKEYQDKQDEQEAEL